MIITVPRNSLTGWAEACRVFTRFTFRRIRSVTESKRADIFFSALNALTMRRPPRVSSTWDIVSLQRVCASRDCRLSCLPITPMIQMKAGTKVSITSIISGLRKMRMPK